ncbi:GntR family trehalose operon transcriptional repressor [Peribacillus deserti]|uniref:Trehalose operon repressor n=1 Tax=Peribacillus deserti TaxID=673318 RepID=A0ABS2QMT9_9BACI|nr:trehalose operon repressor [Peribacillus deserti]MBM7694491.1 GntR family trehalose operon transcriptional repressor [Peribacillus deserti]
MINKFTRVYDDLAQKIQNDELRAGSLLPSENELTELYDTSRETIRKALKMLSEDGYIHKVQGKGSIVLDISKFNFPVSGLVSFKELAQKMGHRARTEVVKLERILPHPEIMENMRLTAGQQVWQVFRVREIDREKIILDKDFLNEEIVPDLTKEICQNSIYEYIESELGLSISFAKKEITVEEPNEEDKTYLNLKGFTNIVVVKNYVYLDDARLFQYTESRHRPDKFRFVDFARRK